MGKDLLLQLANSINPFFRHYSTPRLFGVLVSVSMAVGIVLLTAFNMRCTLVRNSTSKYESVTGLWVEQKLFLDAASARPMGLDNSVKHEINICTLYTTTSRVNALTNVQGTGETYYELRAEFCMLPPDEVLDVIGFPGSFKFCELDAVPESIRSVTIGRSGVQNMEEGKLYAPKDFFNILWDNTYPGWKCHYADSVPAFQSSCAEKTAFGAGIVYNYCGSSRDLEAELIWDKYSDWPSGTMTPFSLGYIISVNTEAEVCPLLSAALGAAIGYVGYIELAFTILFVYLLTTLGVARPLSDHATISNMVKGSGIAELSEVVENRRTEEEKEKEREMYPILSVQPLPTVGID